MTWSQVFLLLRRPHVWVILPQTSNDYQTLFIFGHVTFTSILFIPLYHWGILLFDHRDSIQY